MKKKVKKAIKHFFSPTQKNDHESLHDRLVTLEEQQLNMFAYIAKLEARIDNHDHE